MIRSTPASVLQWIPLFLLPVTMACSARSTQAVATGEDPDVTTRGSIEVTAELVEIPDGAIFKRDLYNYATILKNRVRQVHRGQVEADTIFVGHYNPWKPRAQAADNHVEGIGGNLEAFAAGQVHRMALEAPIDDHYMGGIINKYFGHTTEPIYLAVWTNLAE